MWEKYCQSTGIVKCEKKKNKGTTKCDKSTVTCEIGTTQFEDKTIKCKKKKKKREPLNLTKVLSIVMLVLPNVTMKLSNIRKKIKEPPNITKEQSHMILELHNVRVESSNVKKK